jgi:hypothetical protein
VHGNRNGRSGRVRERDVTLSVLQVVAYILVGNFSLQPAHRTFSAHKPKLVLRTGGLRRGILALYLANPHGGISAYVQHQWRSPGNICCTNVTESMHEYITSTLLYSSGVTRLLRTPYPQEILVGDDGTCWSARTC